MDAKIEDIEQAFQLLSEMHREQMLTESDRDFITQTHREVEAHISTILHDTPPNSRLEQIIRRFM